MTKQSKQTVQAEKFPRALQVMIAIPAVLFGLFYIHGLSGLNRNYRSTISNR